MKHYLLKSTALAVSLLFCSNAMAQGPNQTGTYYQSADKLKGRELKTALYRIIGSPKVTSYSGIWNTYLSSDIRPDGKIWDMYSNTTSFRPHIDQAGNYKMEGDVYNREHSMPKSWFRNETPMVHDAFHVVPSDAFVNNKRSNFPFGENVGEKYSSNGGFSKLGECKTPGGHGTVFEPNDEYKGDFARIYFYMATAYEGKIVTWSSTGGGGDQIFRNNNYKPYVDWQMNMLMRWSASDPVSQKEILRNNAVYNVQKNRNPFVDYPGLEDYVWGDSVNVSFSYDNYKTSKPATNKLGGVYPGSGDKDDNTHQPDKPNNPIDNGSDNDSDKNDNTNHQIGDGLVFKKVTSIADLIVGEQYIIVNEESQQALGEQSGKYRASASISIENNATTTKVNAKGLPFIFKLQGQQSAYTLYNETTNTYLAYKQAGNTLHTAKNADELDAQWAISFSNDNVLITSKKDTKRSIMFNKQSPRFVCYEKGQQDIQLYKFDKEATSINEIYKESNVDGYVYSLSGQKVGTFKDLFHLPKGIYLFNGQKYVVR